MFADSNVLLQMAEPVHRLGSHRVPRPNPDFYHRTYPPDEAEHKTRAPAWGVTLHRGGNDFLSALSVRKFRFNLTLVS